MHVHRNTAEHTQLVHSMYLKTGFVCFLFNFKYDALHLCIIILLFHRMYIMRLHCRNNSFIKAFR